MRNKAKPRGKPFEKGKAPASPGRPPILPEHRAFKKITKELIEETFNKFSALTPGECEAYFKHSESPATNFEHMIYAQIRASRRANTFSFNIIADRTAGPIAKKVDLTHDIKSSTTLLSPEQKQDLVEELEARLQLKDESVIDAEVVSVTDNDD